MDTTRWRRIEAILSLVYDTPDAELDALLSAQCDGDGALRAEVERLLRSDRAAQGFLTSRAADAARVVHSVLDARISDIAIGTQIGSFRVVGELGHGGMGAVYLAERADGAYQQRVAIKVLRAAVDGQALRQRFRAERQILARLEHPNIARLLDGGVTASGSPFLVMEYVDGLPLGAHVRSEGLDLDARLRLFAQISAAVDYAHRRLVVHRDLKPSNVLVTREGQIKLLDFGVAKLLDTELADGSEPLTDAGLRLLTPEYAAPEQLRGDTATTATDVYALGGLLYELLTGSRVFEIPRQRRHQLEQAVLNEEPEVPSARLRKRRTEGFSYSATRLRGDLDTITLTALRKQPELRYTSAHAMAEDVARFQANLPINAHTPGLFYRTSRFVRRNRLATALASLAFLSVSIGSVYAHWQAERAAESGRRASRINAFLLGLFENADPNVAKTRVLTVKQLLDNGRARLLEGLADEPQVRADLAVTIGTLYEQQGLLADAEPLAQLALNDGAVDSARFLRVRIQYSQGAYVDAARECRTLLDERIQRDGGSATSVAEARAFLGRILLEQAQYSEARAMLQQALQSERMAATPSLALSTTITTLARVHHLEGSLEPAETLHREALTLRLRTLNEPHSLIAQSQFNLASVLEAKGFLDEADNLYRKALATDIGLYGEDSQNVALTLNNLGSLALLRGQFSEAETMLRRALHIRAQLYGGDSPRLTQSRHNLARVLLKTRNLDEANVLSQRALLDVSKQLGNKHPNVAAVMLGRAELLQALGKYDEATGLARDALAIYLGQFGDQHARSIDAKQILASVLSAQGADHEALNLSEDVLKARRRAHGDDDWRTAQAEVRLAQILLRRDARSEPARAMALHALARLSATFPAGHPSIEEARAAATR